jgi:hypothetical protein
MQNGYSTAATPHSTADSHGALVRRASNPATSSIPTPSPTNHQRSHSQSWPQSHHPHLYTTHSHTIPPGVDGLSNTHIQAPPHVSMPQSHVPQIAPPAPAAPLPSSHPPAQIQASPQQQPHITPPAANMLIPANVPVRPSTEHSLVQVRPQPPAAAGAAPLAIQLAAATRLREQMQAQAITKLPTTAITVNATSAGASSPSGSGPHAQSPVSGRALPPAASPSQQQQQHQRFAMSPAIAAYKVLQPAKDLLEQTWAAAIAAVQQEFAAVTAELSRSAREKQGLTELIQRLQAERLQVVNALHTTRTELGQCTLGISVFWRDAEGLACRYA